MSYLEDPGQPTKSKGCSIFLWVFGILGLLIVLGCGGLMLTGFLFVKRAQDPDKARAISAEIIDIRVPEGLDPQFSMNLQGMKMVMYSSPSGAVLSLMETPGGNGEAGQEAEQDMQQNVPPQAPPMGNIVNGESEEQTVTIRGEEQTVTILRGKGNQGGDWVQATVPFTAKSGNRAMLTYMVPEDEWDDAEFEAMLESMQ